MLQFLMLGFLGLFRIEVLVASNISLSLLLIICFSMKLLCCFNSVSYPEVSVSPLFFSVC